MTAILGPAVATADQMAAYLLSVNSAPLITMPVRDFCQLFLTEAAREGVRGDILFAQSCKETGNFKFKGTVRAWQNNFAGLGTTDANTPGASFPDEATGIRAQAQHAKAYATAAELSTPCVDPRYSLLVKYGKAGTAPNWEQLGGKWAVPGYDTKKYVTLAEANAARDSYGYQVLAIYYKMLNMPRKQEEEPMKQKIIALDAGHGKYTAGKRCLAAIDPNQTREWYLNDRIMDRVENMLAGYDCKVLRVGDTTGEKDISLDNRCKAANNAGADIYISMHHNAGIHGGTGGGTVVFYYSSNALRKTQAYALYNAIISRTELVGNRSSKVISKAYKVLRGTKMPAFLVENGFMDSRTDTPRILTADHAERTAQGVLAFLVKELGLVKKQAAEQGTGEATEASRNTYTVAKGDTLSKIGRSLGISWQELAKVNGLQSPYTLRVGQVLTLPGGAPAAGIYYPAYTGPKATLTAALNSLDITSTYSFRKQIAAANGVRLYTGTAAQNTALYNLLRAGLLKKVQ